MGDETEMYNHLREGMTVHKLKHELSTGTFLDISIWPLHKTMRVLPVLHCPHICAWVRIYILIKTTFM